MALAGGSVCVFPLSLSISRCVPTHRAEVHGFDHNFTVVGQGQRVGVHRFVEHSPVEGVGHQFGQQGPCHFLDRLGAQHHYMCSQPFAPDLRRQEGRQELGARPEVRRQRQPFRRLFGQDWRCPCRLTLLAAIVAIAAISSAGVSTR